jgi:hypothetical protein
MMKKYLLLGIMTSALAMNAQDRLFTYTYQSGVLNKGQKEMEVWTTIANGREHFYRGIEHRLEFEVGLGSNLQTSVYLNYGYNTAIEEENGIQNLVNETEYSVSNEWKLKLSDPVANKIGSALYLEGELSPIESALEGKILLDKQFGNLTSALNLVGEFVNEKAFVSNGTSIKTNNLGELNLEWNYGLSYSVKEHLGVGFEAFNQNQFVASKWSNSVLLLGPCLSYSTDGFWANVSCMPQIADLKGKGLELKDHEHLQTRLIISYAF